MGFYDKKVAKTISGVDPDYWDKFKVITKGKGSDASKTINLFIQNYVYEWQMNRSFRHKPFDVQIREVAGYMNAPYYRKADYFKKDIDRIAA